MGWRSMRYGVWVWLVCVMMVVSAAKSFAAVQKSHEFGNVTLDKVVRDKGQMPVIFRHWTHRSKNSCRLCHVDIEFGMDGQTEITEEDNKEGRYCGVCHNGKEAFSVSECSKCHPKDDKDAKQQERAAKKEFFNFQKKMPRAIYGNKIDWNKAEEDGIVVVQDFIPGVTFKPEKMTSNLKDEPMSPRLAGLPDIIFSHQKHVAWAGCGMCHPDTFALEAGKTKMSMKEISAGKYCGICHGKVAFPLNDCSTCHSKPVSQ